MEEIKGTIEETEGPVGEGVQTAPLEYLLESKPIPPQTTPTQKTQIPPCPFCGSEATELRSDGIGGSECLECDSVFLGNGTGVTVESGMINNLADAKNLPEELSQLKDEVTITGPFRGNAQLFQIPAKTLPSFQGAVKGAIKAGLQFEQISNMLFIRR